MKDSDKGLLDIYMRGFKDELDGNESISSTLSPLYKRAYELGALDALVGDDVSSSDLQTDEEILKHIRSFLF